MNSNSTEHAILAPNNNLGLLILRLSLGLMMLVHGVSKLTGGLDGVQYLLAQHGLPSFLSYGVLVGEIVAPLLIIVGWRTRCAAAVLAFNMLVALFTAHAAQIFSLSEQGGWAVELVGLYFFGAAALVFTGAGRYALSSSSLLD